MNPDVKPTMFGVGDRVHWYEYSADQIIINGGRGIIVEVNKLKQYYSSCVIQYIILKDDGTMGLFHENDLDKEKVLNN